MILLLPHICLLFGLEQNTSLLRSEGGGGVRGGGGNVLMTIASHMPVIWVSTEHFSVVHDEGQCTNDYCLTYACYLG